MSQIDDELKAIDIELKMKQDEKLREMRMNEETEKAETEKVEAEKNAEIIAKLDKIVNNNDPEYDEVKAYNVKTILRSSTKIGAGVWHRDKEEYNNVEFITKRAAELLRAKNGIENTKYPSKSIVGVDEMDIDSLSEGQRSVLETAKMKIETILNSQDPTLEENGNATIFVNGDKDYQIATTKRMVYLASLNVDGINGTQEFISDKERERRAEKIRNEGKNKNGTQKGISLDGIKALLHKMMGRGRGE